jgi:hypothetical protein
MVWPLDAVRSLRRSVNPRPVDVGFVVNKVAMEVYSSCHSNITNDQRSLLNAHSFIHSAITHAI